MATNYSQLAEATPSPSRVLMYRNREDGDILWDTTRNNLSDIHKSEVPAYTNQLIDYITWSQPASETGTRNGTLRNFYMAGDSKANIKIHGNFNKALQAVDDLRPHVSFLLSSNVDHTTLEELTVDYTQNGIQRKKLYAEAAR
jgi:hypothetical protein